jgi:hypothetical protein
MITPLFHVGQQVVCTNDEFTVLLAQDPRIVTPRKGETYTVRRNFQFMHAVGIALEEITNHHALPKGRSVEPNFSQSRFRAATEVPVTVESREESIYSN